MEGKEVTGAMVQHRGCMLLQPNLDSGVTIYDEQGHRFFHTFKDHILSEDEAISIIEAALYMREAENE